MEALTRLQLPTRPLHLPHPLPLPPTTPYNMPFLILQKKAAVKKVAAEKSCCEKSCSKTSNVSCNSYKTLAK